MGEEKEKLPKRELWLIKIKCLKRAVAYYLKGNLKGDISRTFSWESMKCCFFYPVTKNPDKKIYRFSILIHMFPLGAYRIMRYYYRVFYSYRLKERGNS